MKKIILLVSMMFIGVLSAQVGIHTNSPAATLDVQVDPNNSTKLEGIIAPRLTGAQLRARTYTTAQNGALVYATAADTAPAGQTINVLARGYYYFDAPNNVWVGLRPNSSTACQNSRYTETSGSITIQPNDCMIFMKTTQNRTIALPNANAFKDRAITLCAVGNFGTVGISGISTEQVSGGSTNLSAGSSGTNCVVLQSGAASLDQQTYAWYMVSRY